VIISYACKGGERKRETVVRERKRDKERRKQ